LTVLLVNLGVKTQRPSYHQSYNVEASRHRVSIPALVKAYLLRILDEAHENIGNGHLAAALDNARIQCGIR
jgi:hypothetical protein